MGSYALSSVRAFICNANNFQLSPGSPLPGQYIRLPTRYNIFESVQVLIRCQIADWLESYAKIFELHIWTSSTVLGATQDRDHRWSVRVKRSDGAIRTLQVNHLGESPFSLFAAGPPKFVNLSVCNRDRRRDAETFRLSRTGEIGSIDVGVHHIGWIFQEKFAGIITHSTQYKRADEYKGKKVIVIGAANSAFDIASDLAKNSVGLSQ